MKKELFVLTLVLIIFFSASSVFAQVNLNYKAKIKKELEYINITIELKDIDPSQNKLIFSLPHLPGFIKSEDEFNYLDYLYDLKAYDQEEKLDITKNEDFIEVEVNLDQLVLEYKVEKKLYFPEPFVPDELLAVIYTTDNYAYFGTKYLFLIPERLGKIKNLNVSFDLPDNWKVFAPFKQIDNHYSVKENKVISHLGHLKQSAFYVGETEFIAKNSDNGSTHKIAKLKGDKNYYYLTNKIEANNFINKVTKVYNYYTDIFEINPFPVDLWLPETKDKVDGKQLKSAINNTATGWHYWPNDREFEITCHVVQSFMGRDKSSPLMAETSIYKGIGEYYFGHLAAYELFSKNLELGKMYYTYLVYDRISEKDIADHYEFEYMKGYALAVYLDHKIKEVSSNNYSLKDVIRKLSEKYALKDYKITFKDLQNTIFKLTGNRMEADFNRYVYGAKKIPAYQYLKENKSHFEALYKTLDDNFNTKLGGYVTPLFINIELTLKNNQHIMSGIYFPIYLDQFYQKTKNNYTISKLNKDDVEKILTEIAGEDCSGFFERWNDSYGSLSLEKIKDWLYYRDNV